MSTRDTNTATAAARSNQSAGTAVDRSVDEAIAAAAANGADAAVPTISYRQLVGKPAKPGSFRDRFALTETGVKALVSGAIACAIGNFSLMLPMGVIYLAVIHYVGHLDDPSAPLPEFWPFVAMSVTVLVVMFLAQWWQYDSTYNEIYGESARTRLALAEKLRMLPMSFFSRRSIADLTTAVLADCASLELLFSHVMPELFGATISTTVVAVVMFVYDWRMALAMVWVLPIAVILLLLSRKLQQSLTRAFTKARLSVASGIQESLECAAQLRASGQTDRYLDGLDRRIDAAERAQIRSELIPGTIVSGAQILLTVGKASIILVGAQLVAAGETDFVTYVMFLLCAALIYAPIAVIFESIAELMGVGTHAARLREIHREPAQQGAERFEPNGHDVAFEHVTFSYAGDADGSGKVGADAAGAGGNKETVLSDVSFTARQGEVTALVGPSGGGKSTVTKLAARFWDADAGTVTVGGVDVSGVAPETLLADYAIVFQDVVLFNDTIRENIRLGRRGASDAEVLAAARAANCDEFVSLLPGGYDTVIGENGSTLSGGERQRISIARALLKDAPIVLLDEATASLDVENETKVQGALSRLLRGKTVLVIAHRMRTVMNADKIVVLDGGRVVEEGSPARLIAAGGEFAHMVALQSDAQSWTLHKQ